MKISLDKIQFNRTTKILISISLVACVVVGIILLSQLTKVTKTEEEDEMVYVFANRFSVSTEYVNQKMEELGNWDAVGYRLMQEEHMFTPERATELYRKGYLKEDMEKAQQLEVTTGVDRETILEKRGTYPGQLPWKEVIKELKLDTRSDVEKFGLSKKTIKLLKKSGQDEGKIIQVALKVNRGEFTEKQVVKSIEDNESVDNLLNN